MECIEWKMDKKARSKTMLTQRDDVTQGICIQHTCEPHDEVTNRQASPANCGEAHRSWRL